ncbi:hypothetical protein [Ketogulonicigenium vulgare]|uniref:hypothetical protein n=1 Tax=Ketogulonicigenium vulgare TaxID=92945 RepID=UPI002358AE7C|nr:hypothetical protein [Ketogulonicigenium vulgare]
MRDHAPIAQCTRTANEAQAPNPYNLAPERLRGEAMAAEAKQPRTAREVSTDRADVLQVAGELLGVRRDNRVEAMHHAGLTIRSLQQRIDELLKAPTASGNPAAIESDPSGMRAHHRCPACNGAGGFQGFLCIEACVACDGTGLAAPQTEPTTINLNKIRADAVRLAADAITNEAHLSFEKGRGRLQAKSVLTRARHLLLGRAARIENGEA